MNDVFITYRHFRLFDTMGEMDPKGGATIAFFVDLRNPEDRKMIVGFALCSHKDHFCKATGREVAYQNLSFTRKLLKEGWGAEYLQYNVLRVEPKDESGTLCTQLMLFLEDNYATLPEDSDMYLLSRWMRKHNII